MSTTISRLPSFGISHGAPNLCLFPKTPTYEILQKMGEDYLSNYKPKALLVVSAHWETFDFTINTNQQDVMYDFGGFEKELYTMKYPANTSPELAERVSQLLKENNIQHKKEKREFDHGVWSPLKVMFPKADIPIVQLSLRSNLNIEEHIKLGIALAPLSNEGYTIIGSGSSSHNLWRYFDSSIFPDCQAFVSWLNETFTQHEGEERIQRLKLVSKVKGYQSAHPRIEHLLPLLFVAATGGKCSILHEDNTAQPFVQYLLASLNLILKKYQSFKNLKALRR